MAGSTELAFYGGTLERAECVVAGGSLMVSQHNIKLGLHQPKGPLGQFMCCDSKLQQGTFSASWLGCFFLEAL